MNEYLADDVTAILEKEDVVDHELENLGGRACNAKPSAHLRQIEILRENKLLLSSIKDIYDY